MRTIHILATAATLLAAASAPTLAAQRVHRGSDAYASGAVTTDRSGPYYYGPRDAQGRSFEVAPHAAPSQIYQAPNLPYADRPYGDPDGW